MYEPSHQTAPYGPSHQVRQYMHSHHQFEHHFDEDEDEDEIARSHSQTTVDWNLQQLSANTPRASGLFDDMEYENNLGGNEDDEEDTSKQARALRGVARDEHVVNLAKDTPTVAGSWRDTEDKRPVAIAGDPREASQRLLVERDKHEKQPRRESLRGTEPVTDPECLIGYHKYQQPIERHMFPQHRGVDIENWKSIRGQLPESWKWDVDYQKKTTNHSHNFQGCWTITPMELDDPKSFPLTIAGAPVVIPVDYRWPPIAGVNPPPDPRPSTPIDHTVEISIDIIRDLFLTFEGCIGFYLLINGLLQIIVPEEFDTAWASSHLPHKYGGLRVCYIHQSMDPTMLSSTTENSTTNGPQGLVLNGFIEARPKVHWKEKFSGRIGLKIARSGDPFLVMSTHVITEAILAKPRFSSVFRWFDPSSKLDEDWNKNVEIWADNCKIGMIEKSFDPKADIYPHGFEHHITLVRPTHAEAVRDIQSPIKNLGWLSKEGWHHLRQQENEVKILAETEQSRRAKTMKTNNPSEVLIIGEGVFLNQTASKPTRDLDRSVWEGLVSRAILYRVAPDFDPPNGYSGIALYTDEPRDDGTTRPGVIGFQSFVQRSGPVSNFELEGDELNKRLRYGRVAFYGAFPVPEELRKNFDIV